MTEKSKGNYYQLKTKKFYESEGYSVYNLEQSRTIFTPKGLVYVKKDVAGADLMAMNGEEIIFIQCKTNLSDIGSGKKELMEHPYPSCVKLIVARWEPRAKSPDIYEVLKN